MDARETEIEGLWFAWPEGKDPAGKSRAGFCVLALRGGAIVGADYQYHLGGRYWFDGDRLVARLSAEHYHGVPESIWGFTAGEEIELSGFFRPGGYLELGGHRAGDNTRAETRVILKRLRPWRA